MKRLKSLLVLGLISIWLTNDVQAQQSMNTTRSLDKRGQSIVTISAFTAKGDLRELQNALGESLEAGLTINEIKEVLVHLSAYTGFPRSLQGINTFMSVLEERKAKGIIDKVGKEVSVVQNDPDKYLQGKKVLESLTGQPERNPKTGYAAFAPVIDTFLKEHLFADMFSRDLLTYIDREIATLSALISLGGVEPMMRGHMGIALHLGVTETELHNMLSLLEKKLGMEEADAGRRVLADVTKKNVASDTTETRSQSNLFATGKKAPATNFVGTASVNMVVQAQEGLNCSIGVVTFEPGARTNWHRHPGGQILLVTEGKGYYQERGDPVTIIQKGDVVKCLPGKEHWHGALPGSQLTHIAIGPNADKGAAIWLQPVTDKEYQNPGTKTD